MMSPLTWTFLQLLVFWSAAIALAGLLWWIGRRVQPGPWKFFWLLPARNLLHGILLGSIAFFRFRPFEATALLGVPIATFVITMVWLTGRVLHR